MKISNEELSKRLKESFRPKPTSWEIFFSCIEEIIRTAKQELQNPRKMSNKTALQELKLIIESVLDELPRRTSDFENGKEEAFNYVLSIINDNSIEKEKQQIMEAWTDGRKPMYKNIPNFNLRDKSEEYYAENYRNQQGDPEENK